MTLTETSSVVTPAKKGFTHESTNNESFEWYTPPVILDALGLTFDLDPCSPGAGKSFVPALKHYTIDDDGLTSPWAGTVWMNPPYGPLTPVWMKKMSEHRDGIALVFARTDVRWFQDYAAGVSLVCFVSGRIKFYKGDIVNQGGTPGAGSMLVAWGDKAAAALQASGLGVCFAPSL
jgi:hypothetical protein